MNWPTCAYLCLCVYIDITGLISHVEGCVKAEPPARQSDSSNDDRQHRWPITQLRPRWSVPPTTRNTRKKLKMQENKSIRINKTEKQAKEGEKWKKGGRLRPTSSFLSCFKMRLHGGHKTPPYNNGWKSFYLMTIKVATTSFVFRSRQKTGQHFRTRHNFFSSSIIKEWWRPAEDLYITPPLSWNSTARQHELAPTSPLDFLRGGAT